MVTPGAADANGSVGLIYTETRKIDDLPPVSVQPSTVVGARTPIPDHVVGVDRLVRLGSAALWEAVDAELAAKPIGLVVCAPSELDEPELSGSPESLLHRLAGESQLSLAKQGSKVFSSGRESMLHALPFAVAALEQYQLAAVCLLGVDSLVTKPRLRLRLGRGDDSEGILGEGAAAVVLTSTREPKPRASLRGMGIGNESSTMNGKAMLAAVNQSIAEARLGKPVFDVLVHDTTGSPAEDEELAWAKTGQAFVNSTQMSTFVPSWSVGNAGAASPVLSLATLAYLVDRVDSFRTGLCCLSSEKGRGAVILA
jgi:hypothetical protein